MKNKLYISVACAIGASLSGLGYSSAVHAAGGQSYASVQASGQSATSRSVVLPYGKSTIIELPEAMGDVIVSDPEIVESLVHTSNRVMMIGRETGQTNAYIYGQSGNELLNLDIRVERDLGGLTELINRHLPGNQIEVTSVNNNILLSGPVENAAATDAVIKLATLWMSEGGVTGAGEVVNLMTLQGREQVMLKVRIVEMQRSVTKQMGIDLSAIGQLGDSTVSLISDANIAAEGGFQAGVNYTNSSGGSLDSLGATLQALESVGLVRTKAEPTLTAISGETANFEAGGEFPVVSGIYVDEFGQAQRNFEFKNYGVSLGFTPTVLSENRISLQIETEVSEPTNEGATADILGLRKRSADTTVELPAGGSLVIAGLIREEVRQASTGTPGLKDVPGVGALFRNRDDSSTQTELVVMVTPYLVDPVHPDKLQTPLDGFVPSSDREALLLGRLNKIYSKPGANVTGRSLQGPFGHVVD